MTDNRVYVGPAGEPLRFDSAALLAELIDQEERFALDRLGYDEAARLGGILAGLAHERGLPVVVRVELLTPGSEHGEVHTVFQRAFPGSSPTNDWWLGRKSAVVRHFGHSSFAVGTQFRVDGGTFEEDSGLDVGKFAAHGGAFPLRVKGQVVGVAGVSGLRQEDDHALVVEALAAYLS